ncbi:hydroxymethylpyrimidine/phosphomethylpyrimidine kinase [Cellulomonas sp. PhB143]|nr:hydroxymethylpyrimidine/phosphomethylpyrimidine kinase [Cellulomonas sp. PhB143]
MAPSPADGARSVRRATGSRPRVLSVAGTDPTGGAGIQADLKSFAAHGAYGMAVTTAVVAQNTHGVRLVHVPGPEVLAAQLDAVSDDVAVDAVKIGMVADAAGARTIARWLDRVRPPFVVLDPVMVATSGHRLLDAGAEDAVRALVGRAEVVTPNVPELAVLLGETEAGSWEAVLDQAARLAATTGTLVLAKGGHLAGTTSPDALVSAGGCVLLEAERVETPHTHGTGCSLSAALAALRPQRDGWEPAAREAKEWLTGALRAGGALAVGTGRGPVDHLHELVPARPFSEEAWERVAPWRSAIEENAFVRALGDGSLAPAAFASYLAQDAAYLEQYSRVLSRASAAAPDPGARAFFARSALGAVDAEQDLHVRWLAEHAGMDADDVARVEPSGVTAAYTGHLHAAAAGSYAETVAALLPCFWLYAHVGESLAARAGDLAAHPYGAWIAQYADPAFAEATRRACGLADAAARAAGPAERRRMLRAFELSAMHEQLFFDQGLEGTSEAQTLVPASSGYTHR